MASSSSDSQDSATAAGESVVSATSSPGLFPFVIVATAVFPIALGFGFTLQTVPPAPGKLSAAEQSPASIPNQIQPKPEKPLAVPDRTQGDELLREGRYEAALHLYRSLGSENSLRVSPEIALRMALCQEGLGAWDDALATYRSVASSNHSRCAAIAVLGQARLWMKLDEYQFAEPLLRSLILRCGDGQAVPGSAKVDVAGLFSIAVAEQSMSDSTDTATAGLSPVNNLIDWSIDDALSMIAEKSAESADESLNSESGKGGTAVENETAGIGLSDPLFRPIQIKLSQQSAVSLLQQVAEIGGLQFDSSAWPENRDSIQSLECNVDSLPLCLLVHVICREAGVAWQYDVISKTISIVGNGDHPPSVSLQRESARLSLKSALEAFPKSRVRNSLKFALGQIAAAEGCFDEAGECYSSLVGRRVTPLSIRAAFNAALAFHKVGNLIRTSQALEPVVHGAPGDALCTPALILYGRVLMDLGDYREATFQLKRAAESRHLASDQARASVFLAMAQLLDEKPGDAGESLFAHRLQYQDRTVRNAAALMTSIARWRTSSAVSKNREAAFLYRSIVAVQSEAEWLGPSGQYLLGQAMQAASLDEQMEQLYVEALKHETPAIVEAQMKLALADYWYSRDRNAEARAAWFELYSGGGKNSIIAGLRLAELSLKEKQPELCLELCRSIQDRENAPRQDVLKLAGHAYEQAGFPFLAARCYAGEWPLP